MDLKIAPQLEQVAPQFLKRGAVLHLRKKLKIPGLVARTCIVMRCASKYDKSAPSVTHFINYVRVPCCSQRSFNSIMDDDLNYSLYLPIVAGLLASLHCSYPVK